jgi:antitoxin (DNA-binding transcriptional repressor) of toxin-antitoxin stability system
MCHVKTISIRELHEKTGEWIRRAGEHGEILVTDRRKAVAKILPEAGEMDTPYFSHRVISPAFRKLMDRAKLRRGTDSTQIVSEERDRRIS